MADPDGKTGASRRRELRRFGLTMAGALALLGLVALWRGKAWYAYPGGAALGFVALGLAWPRVLAPVYRGWMALARVLGWVMTRVILTLLFYVAVTPIGLIGRLAGRRFLDPPAGFAPETYWIRRDRAEGGRSDYERQF